MAWEKVNWKRSKANQLKAMNKNTKLTCSIVDTGGRRGKRKTGTNLPPPPQLSLPFNSRKIL